MPFDFSKAKAQVRQTVHKTFGVPALYSDSSTPSPVDVRVRWYSRIEQAGDLESQGYANVIQGIDRIVFLSADARTLGVKKNGTVKILNPVEPGVDEPVFALVAREPKTGPVEEIWTVVLKG